MRYFLSVGIFVACNLAVFAQNAPRVEIFAGYSYGNYDLIPGSSPSAPMAVPLLSGAPSARLWMNGWNGAATVNINGWFAFTSDLSGYHSGSSASSTSTETFPCGTGCKRITTIVNTAARPQVRNLFFGPQFSYSSDRVRPFAQLLFGGEHVDLTSSVSGSTSGGVGIAPIPQSRHLADTGFALTFGGGVDYSIHRGLALRAQLNYLKSQGNGVGPNHFRVSTGLLFDPFFWWPRGRSPRD